MSICLIVVQTYSTQDEAINPLTPRKYTALNGIFCLICAMFFRNVTLVYESCLNYCSLFDNIHCFGTHRSHCHDTCVMQNLNGRDMPYSWWLVKR